MAAIEAVRMRDVAGPLELRSMRASDAQDAVALSDEAGWNQTIEDWRFMIEKGQAMGLYEPGIGWAASSLTLPQGPGLSWISMVLVARRHRRAGLGTAILRRCIDAVRAQGAIPGLDATELGRPVYLPLGFRDVYTISRFRLDAPAGASTPVGCTIRRMSEADLPAVIAFDGPRTATAREHVLRYLFERSREHACLAQSKGEVVGYAVARPGQRAAQIGPVIADRPDVAIALVAQMLSPRLPAILDVPEAQAELAQWLRRHGAVRERGFTRMTLGAYPGLADASSIYALAGPELG